MNTKKSHVVSEVDYEYVLDTLYFLRSLLETLWDADKAFLRIKMSDLDGFWDALKEAPDASQRIKAIKYFTSWPMAKWLRNDIPACPDWLKKHFGSKVLHFPIRGPLRQHMKNMLASSSNRMRPAKLFVGLLQGVKRGCAPVGMDFIQSTMLSHKASLTQTLPVLEEEISDEFQEKFEALWQRNKTMTFGKPLLRKIGNPGFNACLESKRSDGGKAGYVNKLIRVNQDMTPVGELIRDVYNTDFSFIRDELLRMYETGPGKVSEVRGWPTPTYNELLYHAFIEVNKGPCQARVAPILEPLKCRLITKGPALPYWASMTAQKDMWQHLQNYPQFALTGQMVDGSHLEGILLKEEKLCLDFNKWVSGDYSAATDGLSTEVNSLAFTAYCDSVNASHMERQVWNSVLGCHEVSYPKAFNSNGELDPMMQTNGQLMGSTFVSNTMSY